MGLERSRLARYIMIPESIMDNSCTSKCWQLQGQFKHGCTLKIFSALWVGNPHCNLENVVSVSEVLYMYSKRTYLSAIQFLHILKLRHTSCIDKFVHIHNSVKHV